MGHGVHVTELFGIGTKYEIDSSGDHRLAVIAHKDGTRELYAFEPGRDSGPLVIRLDEEEAKRVAAVLSGTFYSD